MQIRVLPSLLAMAVGAAACTPTLDWRELEPEGSGVGVTFPCKPDRHERSVALAGAASRMALLVCGADDVTYALSFVDVADPALVGVAIEGLRSAAVANVGGAVPRVAGLQVRGMTPHPESARLTLAGRRPDGTAVRVEAVFFAKGLRVYQASVVGATLPPEAVDTFLSSLRLVS